MARSSASRETSRLLTLVAAVVIVAALYLAKAVLVPLALALLFAFLLSSVVAFLQKLRLPRAMAVLITILTVFALLGAIGWTVSRQLLDITHELPSYTHNIKEKVQQYHHTSGERLSTIEKEFGNIGEQLGGGTPKTNNQRHKAAGSSPQSPVVVKEVQSSSGLAVGFLPGVLSTLIEVLLIVVFTFFMLLQQEDLRNRLIRLTGRGELNLKTQAMNEASERVSRYFLLLFAVNVIYGIIIFLVLHFLDLPHALLFGALTALLRFIPYIGAPIAGLLPTAMALAVFPGWERAAIILGVFILIEIVTANYLEPRLYGKHTGVSPLAILVAATFWTLIWGPIGLLLSVPLTVCMGVLGSHVPGLKFMNVLLGDEPVLQPSAHFYQRLLASDADEAREVLECYLKDHPLADLYDSVVIPALALAEHDRNEEALDNSTVEFIDQTTAELVEDLGFRDENGHGTPPSDEKSAPLVPTAFSGEASATPAQAPARNVLCASVRDNADEIAAVMLMQLLERGGHTARALTTRRPAEILAEVAATKPDIVFLSAIPPYSVSVARSLYRKLRAQEPQLPIEIGLWEYTGDAALAAKQISRGESDHLCTTLAQAVALVGSGSSAGPKADEDAKDRNAVMKKLAFSDTF